MMRIVRPLLLPLALLALSLLIGGGLVVVGVDVWIERGEASAARSDLRAALTVTTIAALGWIALRLKTERDEVRHGELVAEIEALQTAVRGVSRRLDDRDADTQQLPRARLYVAGAAVVAQPLPPAAPVLDHKVVEIGQRITRKIVES